MANIGYARVSTTGQDHQTQIDKLTAAGCTKIYSEKQSGKSTENRPELEKALEFIRDEEDTLVVTKLDRLARSTADLCNIVKRLEDKGAAFKVLDQAGMDTSTANGKLLFTIMAGIAEFERDLINSRTSEGRALAKANGVKFGRKPRLDAAGKQAVLADIASRGNQSMQDIADNHGISRKTLYRIKAEAA